MNEPKQQDKPFQISKWKVWEAFERVKANKGAAGVDEQSIEEFEADRDRNLYKIWNRLSSGSDLRKCPVRNVRVLHSVVDLPPGGSFPLWNPAKDSSSWSTHG